jgi:hypothetical protein
VVEGKERITSEVAHAIARLHLAGLYLERIVAIDDPEEIRGHIGIAQEELNNVIRRLQRVVFEVGIESGQEEGLPFLDNTQGED